MEEKKNLFEKAKQKLSKAGKGVKQKLEDTANSVRRAGVKTLDWCDKHREETVAIATVSIPVGYKIIKSLVRWRVSAADKRHRELMTYDRRTDSYLQLRRPLKKKEHIKLAERMANGEGKTEVLSSMGLLK